MKKSYLHLIKLSAFILLISFIGNSCVDELEFERPDTLENSVAIQGKLVKGDPSIVTVTVRRVFDFASEPRLVNAKSIMLINEAGDERALDTDGAGGYELVIPANDPDFQVEYGKGFKIDVELFDGRAYESDFDYLYPVSAPQSLEARITFEERVSVTGQFFQEEVIGFFLNTSLATDTGEKPRLLWELEGTYKLTDSPTAYGNFACRPVRIDPVDKTCYLSISPQTNYIPLDASALTQDALQDYPLFQSSISYLFAEGYYLSLFQQSLSPQAFDYWEQVNQVVNQESGLFAAPSGKIATNLNKTNDVEGDAYGFFYVTEQEVVRVYVNPELAGNPSKRCPARLSESGQAPEDCCNCGNLAGSITQRPEWWEE